MADFNWINAVPVRDWSVPDRGWSVLTLSQRDFARKSNLQRGDDAAVLFAAWAVSYTHLDVYKRQLPHQLAVRVAGQHLSRCLLYTSRCV